MKTTCILLLSASVVAAGMGSLYAADKPEKLDKAEKPAKVVAAETAKPKDIGGAMPLPVAQTFDRENKPSDKQHVEVTASALEGAQYVAYVHVVWGDLDNVIKKDGSQYYSDWDGSLTLTEGTGIIDKKIQFEDKTGKAAASKPAKLPGPGSGRDEVVEKSGPVVDWKSGVVGALDGLRIKITSPDATIHATLVAGKFTIPITITGPTGVAPPVGVTSGSPPPTVLIPQKLAPLH